MRHSLHLVSRGRAIPSRTLLADIILDSRSAIAMVTGWAGPRVDPNMIESSCSVSVAMVLPLEEASTTCGDTNLCKEHYNEETANPCTHMHTTQHTHTHTQHNTHTHMHTHMHTLTHTHAHSTHTTLHACLHTPTHTMNQ